VIAQRKLTPLNVFLESAPADKAERAMINLGFCIRNNAAANVFNKDFDTRNYGVSRYLKIYLYDYDAVEALTDVKVRTNRDRCDGEEDVPAWFFEPGVTFLPEEIEAGLRVRGRGLRRVFRAAHADLMSVEYWEGLQQGAARGEGTGHTHISRFLPSRGFWRGDDPHGMRQARNIATPRFLRKARALNSKDI